MKPYAITVDDFLDDFDAYRKLSIEAPYIAEHNPVDGVVYPDVHLLEDNGELAHKLSMVLGSNIEIVRCVMRRSKEGVENPHIAHEDVSILGSQYSCIIYLNDEDQCEGGTSLLRHRASWCEVGTADNAWREDDNDPCAFDVVMTCPMRPNRAFIFPSCLIHCSQPMGGFGDMPETARVVLVVLFKLVPNAATSNPN